MVDLSRFASWVNRLASKYKDDEIEKILKELDVENYEWINKDILILEKAPVINRIANLVRTKKSNIKIIVINREYVSEAVKVLEREFGREIKIIQGTKKENKNLADIVAEIIKKSISDNVTARLVKISETKSYLIFLTIFI